MLASLLDSKSGGDYVGQLVLLSDSLTDGSFLLHHFLQQSLKNGNHTVLVSLTHTFLHYSSISSKFGLNLMKKKDDGRFIFVDGLTALLSQTFISSASRTAVAASTTAATAKSLVHPTLALDSDLRLCGALETVESVLMGAGEGGNEPVCVLVDGFSVLLNVGVALSEAVLFIQRCMYLLTSSRGLCKGTGYLVLMVHREGGREEELLYRHLLHHCHLHLDARGLSTGYSRDVHGERCGREELHKQTKQQMDHSFETTYKSAHTILCLVVSQPRISYIFLQGLCQLQNYA